MARGCRGSGWGGRPPPQATRPRAPRAALGHQGHQAEHQTQSLSQEVEGPPGRRVASLARYPSRGQVTMTTRCLFCFPLKGSQLNRKGRPSRTRQGTRQLCGPMTQKLPCPRHRRAEGPLPASNKSDSAQCATQGKSVKRSAFFYVSCDATCPQRGRGSESLPPLFIAGPSRLPGGLAEKFIKQTDGRREEQAMEADEGT